MSDEILGTEAALWYWRYSVLDYELCDSEEEAAFLGAAMEDGGTASVEGIQFPDGRTIDRDAWPAFAAAERQREEARREQLAHPVAVPRRKIRDPFRGVTISVEADAPAWLGRQQ